MQPKSYLLGMVLVIVFQPVGLLYSTIGGGLVMIALLLMGYGTFYISGESLYAYAFFWIQPPLNLVWSVVAIRRYNKEVEKPIKEER